MSTFKAFAIVLTFSLVLALAKGAYAIQVKNGANFVYYDGLEGAAAVFTDPATSGRDPTAFGGVGLPWTQDPDPTPGDNDTLRTILNSPAPANHGSNFLEINRTGQFGEPDPATANFTQQTTGVLTSEFAFRISDYGPANEADLKAVMYGGGNNDFIGGIRMSGGAVQLMRSGGETNIGLDISDNDWHTALFTYDIAGNSISLSVDGGSATSGTPANNVAADAWRFTAAGPSTIANFDAVGPLIPEPSTVVMVALGIVGVLARARWRRR